MKSLKVDLCEFLWKPKGNISKLHLIGIGPCGCHIRLQILNCWTEMLKAKREFFSPRNRGNCFRHLFKLSKHLIWNVKLHWKITFPDGCRKQLWRRRKYVIAKNRVQLHNYFFIIMKENAKLESCFISKWSQMKI